MDSNDLLKKVRKIEIKTRALSSQIFAGEYHSAFKGRGMAFSEVREYQIGDDVRNMDWNVTARTGTPYIKVFEEERELTVLLLIDASGSGWFGTSSKTKKDLTAEIAAVLSFSASINNDKVGALFFSTRVEKFIPPKKGRSHLLRIIREVLEFRPEEKGTDIGEALRFLTNALKKKCTAFLLSDMLDIDPQTFRPRYEDALRGGGTRHHRAVINNREGGARPPPGGGLPPEGEKEPGRIVAGATSRRSVRESYGEWARKAYAETLLTLRKYKVDTVSIRTDQDYVKSLVALFQTRA